MLVTITTYFNNGESIITNITNLPRFYQFVESLDRNKIYKLEANLNDAVHGISGTISEVIDKVQSWLTINH